MLTAIEKQEKPALKTTCSGSPAVHNGLGILEHLSFSHRVRLITLSTVCAVRGADPETIIHMVDDGLHARHIRFAFNVGTGRRARELRFYVDELVSPALTRNFTVRDAIARILGGRSVFRRSELEVAWTMSAMQFSRLIKANLLKAEHGRVLRADAESFLFDRWSGNNPN